MLLYFIHSNCKRQDYLAADDTDKIRMQVKYQTNRLVKKRSVPYAVYP